jgi:hypothetical protein
MTTIISIDPGMSGAVAWLYNGNLIRVEDLPIVDKNLNPSLLYDMLTSTTRPSVIVVERQQAMPPMLQGRQQGSASTFKTGMGYGLILGVVASLQCPVVTPTPGSWKKTLGLSKDKERSRKLALDTWPELADRFKFKKNEGRAEAALLGLSYYRSLPQAPDQGKQPLTKANFELPRRVVRRKPHTTV